MALGLIDIVGIEVHHAIEAESGILAARGAGEPLAADAVLLCT